MHKIKYIKSTVNHQEKSSNDQIKTELGGEISGGDLNMVFVVREDLKMGAGKQCSQVAHAAVGRYYLK